MYSYCPHCGQTLEQEQTPGQLVICRHCGQEIGVVQAAPAAVMVDGTEELIRQGTAARCPICQQVVESRTRGADKTFVPHFAKSLPRKMCPGSSKSITPAPIPAEVVPQKKPPPGKDLRAYMTKDVIKVILCRKDAAPTIEELTLEYLDKTDRVRLQIEALREILGPDFRLRDNPLNQPQLAVWGHATACIVAKKHPQGGYQAMTDAEIAQVLAILAQIKTGLFA